VGIAERHSFPHEVVGQVGCGRESLAQRFAHAVRPRRDTLQQLGEEGQHVAQRVGGVKERLLVLLVVLVIGERLALHHRQQRNQRAVDTPGLAAHELGNVRVLLLRHDRGTGAEAVGDGDEAETRAHPDHQLLRQAGDVHHRHRRGGEEFDREVPVGHGVERVLAHAVEPQLLRHRLAVDREARAGEGGGAQRQAVHAAARIHEALRIPAEHLEIGHQMVAEGDRLGHLQVREPGHQGLGVLPGQVEQRFAQVAVERQQRVDLGAQP